MNVTIDAVTFSGTHRRFSAEEPYPSGPGYQLTAECGDLKKSAGWTAQHPIDEAALEAALRATAPGHSPTGDELAVWMMAAAVRTT